MHPNDLLRELPSVDRLLQAPAAAGLLARFSRPYVARACREALADLRARIREGGALDAAACDEATLLGDVERRLRADGEPALPRVVNATGTLLHTNLGRAVLPDAAIEALLRAAGHPVALEYELAAGQRGRRETAVEPLLTELSGAEAATVVNNNAAAVLLALNTLAEGREVVVSRGELIEIGGSFRIPDIMAKSGAILREVGTTNRTHPHDYESAIGPHTALLLKVHASNYRIVGFTTDVSLADLVAIGRKHHVPVMEDLGSGALVDLGAHGLPREPVVGECIAAGADLVTFSGDKLLGGPQAGLVVGRKEYVAAMSRNPLHRAVRCDKLTLAALEATLRLYQRSPEVMAAIPALRALARPLAEIEADAREVLPRLRERLGPGYEVVIEDSTSEVGSGALPAEGIPTRVIVVTHEDLSAGAIAAKFRRARPPIIGRIHDGRFMLDLRSVGDASELVPVW